MRGVRTATADVPAGFFFMFPGDAIPHDRVTVEELIRSYETARRTLPRLHRSTTLAELTPQQAAGALIEEHGLQIAALLARSRVEYGPASWEYEFLTWQLLDSARQNAVGAAPTAAL